VYNRQNDYKEVQREYAGRIHLAQSRLDVGCCKYGTDNEYYGSIKCGKFLSQLSDYQLFGFCSMDLEQPLLM
jgi:hypothetical protein